MTDESTLRHMSPAEIERELERRVRERTRELTVAVENAMTGISRLDREGRFVMVHDGYARMLGYEPDELLGESWTRTVPVEDHPIGIAGCEEMIRNGRAEAVLRAVRKDGSTFLKQLLLVKAYEENGQPDGHHCFMRDITEQVGTEQQLRQAQKMEALGRLAGGVAHDFNNILTVILANANQLLAEGREGAGSTAALQEIRIAGEKAAELTRQLLTFSRKELSSKEPVDPVIAISAMEPMLRRLIGEDIQLEFRIAERIGQLLLDPSRLEQIVLNLALNGAESMPTGGKLEIRIEAIDDCDCPGNTGRGCMKLTVTDTGVGIPAEVLPQVFEPFFTTKRSGEGTGLGLATVYGAVKQMGGQLHVDSAPDRGSCFAVFLPLADREAESPVPDRSARDLRGTEVVLLCEDDSLVRGVTHQMLERAGYTVLCAENGTDALAIVEQFSGHIDLVISDVVMPGMNGRQLVDVLSRKYPEIRALLVSGYTSNVITDHGVRAAGIGFLSKPYRQEDLLQRARQLLESPRE